MSDSIPLGQLAVSISSGKDKNDTGSIYSLYGSTGIIGYCSNFSYDGDYILVARVGANAGKVSKVSGKFSVTDNTLVIELKEPKSRDYIFYALQEVNFQRLKFGTGQPLITGKILKSLPVKNLALKEMREISNYFISVDTKISQLTEKNRLLKEYKKGVIQQIFSQQIRFKNEDGNEFPEWEEDRLDSFISRINDPVEVKQATEYREIGIRCHGKGLFHKEKKTGKELGNKRVFWVQPKALIINIVFAWERAVAVTSESEQGFIASHRFPMFVPVKGKSDLDYLLYFFLSPRGEYLLNLASPGGAGRNKTLGQAEFARLKVKLPSLAEQQKIAQFLQSLDKKIEAVAEQIEQTKQFKKGLLQQMFV